MKIYPYSGASESAKVLANSLGIKRLKREGGAVAVDILINWGCSAINREVVYEAIINHPAAVKKAANKLETFRSLDGTVPLPDWTESFEEASGWLAEGYTVVARTELNGHSGQGIVLADHIDQLPLAKLYTKYVNKDQEYRVHVFRGEVIFEQRKARKKDVPDDQVNWKIRNHGNGFIFAHRDVFIAPDGKEAAVQAVEKLGLDFGAVDLMLGKNGLFYVLEVNTACGLEGTTLERYTEAFRRLM